jgi:hypothetical protein
MKTRLAWVLITVAGLALVLAGWVAYELDLLPIPARFRTEEVERTDYHPPQGNPEEVLVDDKLEDKTPLPFDAALVDRRTVDYEGQWLLNASAAVIKLDVPLLKPDSEQYLLTLHPSYAAALRNYPGLLPSVNLLDGKAKQFDDGLYAALDQAYYRGLQDKLLSHVQLVHRLYDKFGKDGLAAPYLGAGLELAGVQVEVTDRPKKDKLLAGFKADEVASKPIGFYTWNEDLSACFRFLRFFQQPFPANDLAVPFALAGALAEDKALLADYQKALTFYARLTNPARSLSVADLVGKTPEQAGALAREKHNERGGVALFPESTSKETVLFEKLFPLGLPPNADLMRELVRRIRSGEVDLRPGPESGWYDHQVYALETLLLPEKGEEHNKLLLTRAYKKRMLEAFQALITKRRETHVRQLGPAAAMSQVPPMFTGKVHPRLRVEPNLSYYLRTARAYAFLDHFLEAALGPDVLQQLHGLKKDGERPKSLAAELHELRDLFYGLYLVSAEDIGWKPSFAMGENVDEPRCYQLAVDWLPKVEQDEDLAADTRVVVPVYVDAQRGVVRLWATLGVRLTKLEAEYVRPPQLKPAKGEGEWQEVEQHRLASSDYLIAVDEFAEVETKGLHVPTREEWRAVCDREKTREAILKALQH